MAVYCTREAVELIYGTVNVSKWADANNNNNAGEVTARIAWAIQRATDWINDELRGGRYKIPFTTAPQTIVDLCAQLAGVLLYQSPRGLVDGNDSGEAMTNMRDEITETVRRINAGMVVLSTKQNAGYVPAIVKEE